MCTPVEVKVRYTIGTDTPGPTFSVPFPIVSDFSDVEVLLDPTGDSGFTTKVEGTHFTFDRDTLQVEFIEPHFDEVEDGGIVVIQRCTLRPRQTTNSDDGVVVGRVLNADGNQAFGVMQEIEAGLYDCMRKEPGGRWFDSEGIEIQNGSPASVGHGYVTLDQLRNEIIGVNTAIIDNSTVLTYEGDGAETMFQLTGFKNLARGQCYVTVKAVPQSARPTDPVYNVINPTDAGYPVDGSGFSYLQFTVAPDPGAAIEVRIFSGTVATSLQADSVETDTIVDGAVTLPKIDAGEGDAGRFLVADADGGVTAAVPTPSDIAGFDDSVVAHELSDFAAPDAALDLGGQLIQNLQAGSETTDATNLGQMNAAILAAITSTKGTCQSAIVGMLSIDEAASDIEIGFTPDVFVLTAEYAEGRDATWLCYFGPGSVETRRLGAAPYMGGSPGEHLPPSLQFQKVGASNTRIRISLKSLPTPLTLAWLEARYIALKLG